MSDELYAVVLKMITKPFRDFKNSRSPTFRGLVFATSPFSQKLVINDDGYLVFPPK